MENQEVKEKMKHRDGNLHVRSGDKSRNTHGVWIKGKHFNYRFLQVHGATEEEAETNAERVALCWNSHDELVQALHGMVDMFGEEARSTYAERKAAESQAKSVLSKVKSK